MSMSAWVSSHACATSKIERDSFFEKLANYLKLDRIADAERVEWVYLSRVSQSTTGTHILQMICSTKIIWFPGCLEASRDESRDAYPWTFDWCFFVEDVLLPKHHFPLFTPTQRVKIARQQLAIFFSLPPLKRCSFVHQRPIKSCEICIQSP